MEKARRYSKKREALIQALQASTEHPSAEMLYTTLKEQFPDLSLGTVYRNLSQMRQDGTIISVATVAGQERYDANIDEHTHFICRNCHQVIDLFDVRLEDDHIAEAAEKYGHNIESQELLLRGVCNDCRKHVN